MDNASSEIHTPLAHVWSLNSVWFIMEKVTDLYANYHTQSHSRMLIIRYIPANFPYIYQVFLPIRFPSFRYRPLMKSAVKPCVQAHHWLHTRKGAHSSGYLDYPIRIDLTSTLR